MNLKTFSTVSNHPSIFFLHKANSYNALRLHKYSITPQNSMKSKFPGFLVLNFSNTIPTISSGYFPLRSGHL